MNMHCHLTYKDMLVLNIHIDEYTLSPDIQRYACVEYTHVMTMHGHQTYKDMLVLNVRI